MKTAAELMQENFQEQLRSQTKPFVSRKAQKYAEEDAPLPLLKHQEPQEARELA